MTQPNRRRVEGEGPSGKPKARRVSPRKELAVVTLGMVAAISGVGGLLAANPPSWANTPEPAAVAVEQTTVQQEAAREAAARAETARQEAEQAVAGQEGAEQAAAEQYAAEQAAAQAAQQAAAEQAALAQQQAAYSAQPRGNAAAVSQGS
ncbi:hypothetical protein GBA65_06405 [Rubrobacter marinus]|uniref:Uncharacterized protein n=1 Tax=Rubrobacter marinus TaxID=2653852 RepID=A0A6G8PVH1_9ACTN|nr:hypothetical protein [Rubrobacter marinus]QIN78202.1 hypothetical protein GBA65_06405 [Rubrobacter marinus]